MKDIEYRVIKDANRFYNAQIRFLPLEDHEPGDGWRTFYITSSESEALRKIGATK